MGTICIKNSKQEKPASETDLERALNSIPDFDKNWSGETMRKWLDDFIQLLRYFPRYTGNQTGSH